MSDSNRSVGTVVALWRYPVKSMQGEELNASEITERGLLGDRACALVDAATSKVVSAKNPKKWPHLFDFRAAFAEPPRAGAALPGVRVTLPDGRMIHSGKGDTDQSLSSALGRPVALHSAAPTAPVLEEYWPDMEELPHRDTVTDEKLPAGAFFDLAQVHVLTTATLARLRALYPAGQFEVRRFRPNLVLAVGEEGFVENAWVGKTLAVGDMVRLRISGPCPRCVMTTLPQADLPHDPDILRTAGRHNGGNVGVYASVVQGGLVRRGDTARLV
jgi:uncharacterized protein YcbX